ncbi:MAG: SCO family protein [Gemmatimonadota bacterium]
MIPGGRAKGEWTLTATDGQPFDFREETAGQVTLLFFGYTHCPNTCPVQMATLGAAYEKLSWDVQRRIEVLFVTTDPARDTLARLRSWLDNFSDDFVGLRGSREKVDSIMASYGLPAAQVDSTPPGPGSPGDGYTVNHAGQILVFTPDNELRLMYPTGVRQREWVSDLRTLTRVGAAAATVSPTASGESSGAGGPGPDGSTANGPP